MTRALTEGMLPTARLNLHHLRVNSRAGLPRVLLLGGSNFDLRYKRAFLQTDLAQQCDLATYEPRGIGRTDHPDGIWTMDDYARDALAVMDALGWDDAFVVGESFGGMTALHLALLAPARVRGIVIASATAGGPDHSSYDIAAFLDLPREEAAVQALCLQDTRNQKLRTTDPAAFDELLTARIAFEKAFADPSITSGGYARLLNARRGHDLSEDTAQILCPTLVISGEFDEQAKPDAQKALAASLPNAAFHSLPAGHGVLFSTERAIELTLDFLSSTAEQDLPKSRENV